MNEEQVNHISEAYADVSAQLGIERLRAQTNISQQQQWRVERLERVTEHLRAALVGTPKERITSEQWEAALTARTVETGGRSFWRDRWEAKEAAAKPPEAAPRTQTWNIRVCKCGFPLGAALAAETLVNCPDCGKYLLEEQMRSVNVVAEA